MSNDVDTDAREPNVKSKDFYHHIGAELLLSMYHV